MDRIGRYKIVRELGRGAMGVVCHAIDPNIGRPVAIKTIQFGLGRKPEELDKLRERLFREARSAGMLSHPGIVTIYDVEQQDELAFIAMEYVDGPTLDQVLSEPEPIAPVRMFNILAQTAVALDYAHSKGLVHRDIKPANIMLAADGLAKKPEARYRNCQEFVEALEAAGASTRGWTLMPRGGLLNAPTVSDAVVAPAIALPPPRRPRRAGSDTTGIVAKRRFGFVPFL